MSTPQIAAIERHEAPRTALLEPQSMAELQQLGLLMAQSGFFSDARSAAQACVKILAGREMGFPPIASMTGVHIIEGKPSMGANLIAAAMKRAGYGWRVMQRDARGCKLLIQQHGKDLGTCEYMEEDARRAGVLGKKNWTSFPKSMYFARAISDAGRTYAPEIFGGLPMYTSEELGLSETTEDGGALPLPIVPPPVAEQPLTAAQERLTQAADPIAEFEVQFRNSDKFGRLRSFQVLKEKLKAVLGDTEGEGRYYELLGMSDVKHSNQFTTLGSALICAKLMLQQLLAAEAAANLNEELAGSGDQHE